MNTKKERLFQRYKDIQNGKNTASKEREMSEITKEIEETNLLFEGIEELQFAIFGKTSGKDGLY